MYFLKLFKMSLMPLFQHLETCLFFFFFKCMITDISVVFN